MSGRFRVCSSYRRTPLIDGWQVGTASSTTAQSSETIPADIRWSAATVPGTVASSLRDTAQWSLDSAPREFDAEEWWYRTRFSCEPATADEHVILGFDGLATFAQVRLNGHLVIDSTNMFLEHRCDIGALLKRDNELVIRFLSLDTFLGVRRPRARWRTPMVKHQQLRWARTTLLGRTPGWSPPAAAVGPWRPVWLERQQLVSLGEHRIQPTVVDGNGRLAFSGALSALGAVTLKSAGLVIERQGQRYEAALNIETQPSRIHGELLVPRVDLWWPHTHGEPALYNASLHIAVEDCNGRPQQVEVDLGSVGFRTLRLDRGEGRFAFYVNEREVFCRGASWTPVDCVSLQATHSEYQAALERVRCAGMNMLRVAGPLVYENDEFLDQCDAMGILLWQDFMFANMDYPTENAGFLASVQAEARQQLSRLQARPALVLLCGNSEGAQQAAMSGAGRECWSPPFFALELASLSRDACPDVPYCPSSTDGGAFPFQPDSGVTSYYGVGAYLQPLTDARRSGVRFASECLAFANVPEEETLALVLPGQALRCHHPRWKERVPRDLGAGWDFDDVRDHYLARLFNVDLVSLRYADHDRYLRLARVSSGEVMAASFAEWRRAASRCSGALLWFLGDLWPGAGWGVVDSTGLPKAAYYHIKRVLQPFAVFVTDEGCNGLAIHLINEAATTLDLNIELQMFRHSAPVGIPVSQVLALDAASNIQLRATDLYEGFVDLSYAYRFGPPAYDVLRIAASRVADGAPLGESFYFPLGLPNSVGNAVGLSASATARGDDWHLNILSKGFAQSVHVDVPGFVADDQYFHMAPNSARTLILRRRRPCCASTPEGDVYALNAAASCRIAIAA